MIYKIVDVGDECGSIVDLSVKEYTKYLPNAEPIIIKFGDLVLKLGDYKYASFEKEMYDKKYFGNAIVALHLKTNMPIGIFEKNLKRV